ncbi:MAG: peptidase T [Oscillospiraceae bacterium]
MSDVSERFIRYAKIDTQSCDNAGKVPSTEKQFDLARLLEKELCEIGASDVRVDEHCYVYASIPASESCKKAKVLGLLAHMDTSPAVSNENTNPIVTNGYDGNDIVLSKELGLVLSPSDFPELRNYIGMDIITTDGTTLLGADDKAGIAEIMTAADYLIKHREIEHGEIKICFTPDEEVGAGVDFFDTEGFGADFAYTLDGGALGEITYENFNAANAKVNIKGLSIHPGSAKNSMVNAALVAMEFQSLLPVYQNPACTEGYDGFFHLDSLTAECDHAQMVYILRDHDMAKFEQKKELFIKAGEYLNAKYGKDTVKIELSDSYYNMREKLVGDMHLIDNAVKAMRELGIEPNITPIRGGTDGARLSYMGLPCPNLCTGGANFHGRFEYIPVQCMEKTVDVLLKIIDIYAKA